MRPFLNGLIAVAIFVVLLAVPVGLAFGLRSLAVLVGGQIGLSVVAFLGLHLVSLLAIAFSWGGVLVLLGRDHHPPSVRVRLLLLLIAPGALAGVLLAGILRMTEAGTGNNLLDFMGFLGSLALVLCLAVLAVTLLEPSPGAQRVQVIHDGKPAGFRVRQPRQGDQGPLA